MYLFQHYLLYLSRIKNFCFNGMQILFLTLLLISLTVWCGGAPPSWRGKMTTAPPLSAMDKLKLFFETEATAMIADPNPEFLEDDAAKSTVDYKSEASRARQRVPRRKPEIILPNMKVSYWCKLTTDDVLNNLIKGTISKGHKAEKVLSSSGPILCGVCLVPRSVVIEGQKRKSEAAAYAAMISTVGEEDQETRRKTFADRQQQSKELHSLIDLLIDECDSKGPAAKELSKLVNVVTTKLETNEAPVPSRHQSTLDIIENIYSSFPVPGMVEHLVNGKRVTKPIERNENYFINVFEEVVESPRPRSITIPVNATSSGCEGTVPTPTAAVTKISSPSPPVAVVPMQPPTYSPRSGNVGFPKGRFLGVYKPKLRFLRYQALCEAFNDLTRVKRIPSGLVKQLATPRQRCSKNKNNVTHLRDWAGSLFVNLTSEKLYSLFTNSKIKSEIKRIFNYLQISEDEEMARKNEITAMQFVLDLQSMYFPSHDINENIKLAREDYCRMTESKRNTTIRWTSFHGFMIEYGLMIHTRDLQPSEHTLSQFYSQLLNSLTTRIRDPDYIYSNLIESEHRTKQRTVILAHCDAIDTSLSGSNKRDFDQFSRRMSNSLDKGHIITSLATIFPKQYTDELQRIHEKQNQLTVSKLSASVELSMSTSLNNPSVSTSSVDDLDELLEYLANESDGSSDSIRQAKVKVQSRVKSRLQSKKEEEHQTQNTVHTDNRKQSTTVAEEHSTVRDKLSSQLMKVRSTVRKKLERQKVKEHPPAIVDNVSFKRKYRPSTALGASTRSLKKPTQAKSLVGTTSDWKSARSIRATLPGGEVITYKTINKSKHLIQTAIQELQIDGCDDDAFQLRKSYNGLQNISCSYLAAAEESAKRKEENNRNKKMWQSRRRKRPQGDEELPMFLPSSVRRGYGLGSAGIQSNKNDAYEGDIEYTPAVRRLDPFEISRLHSRGDRVRDCGVLERVVVENAVTCISSSQSPQNPISCNSLLEVISSQKYNLSSLPPSFSTIQQKYFSKFAAITSSLAIAAVISS